MAADRRPRQCVGCRGRRPAPGTCGHTVVRGCRRFRHVAAVIGWSVKRLMHACKNAYTAYACAAYRCVPACNQPLASSPTFLSFSSCAHRDTCMHCVHTRPCLQHARVPAHNEPQASSRTCLSFSSCAPSTTPHPSAVPAVRPPPPLPPAAPATAAGASAAAAAAAAASWSARSAETHLSRSAALPCSTLKVRYRCGKRACAGMVEVSWWSGCAAAAGY